MALVTRMRSGEKGGGVFHVGSAKVQGASMRARTRAINSVDWMLGRVCAGNESGMIRISAHPEAEKPEEQHHKTPQAHVKFLLELLWLLFDLWGLDT
jgi:hypothetical protein